MLQRRSDAVLNVLHRQDFFTLHYAFQYASVKIIKVLFVANVNLFYKNYQNAFVIYEEFLKMLQWSQDETKLKDFLFSSFLIITIFFIYIALF